MIFEPVAVLRVTRFTVAIVVVVIVSELPLAEEPPELGCCLGITNDFLAEAITTLVTLSMESFGVRRGIDFLDFMTLSVGATVSVIFAASVPANSLMFRDLRDLVGNTLGEGVDSILCSVFAIISGVLSISLGSKEDLLVLAAICCVLRFVGDLFMSFLVDVLVVVEVSEFSKNSNTLGISAVVFAIDDSWLAFNCSILSLTFLLTDKR
ncbi:hypothetical protein FF38_09759 [Lucilia cuprina]|uniref:Uncharacterized protein n=1 Tax=Lucilia cuprina TaxID=7375 RepID=A0A0L0BP00_LUCCU|nr:hypothetical protein FF38_09759 [Lucilia cuprina]